MRRQPGGAVATRAASRDGAELQPADDASIRSKWHFTVNAMFSADRSVPLNAKEPALTFDDDCR
jgi:hypothetical protein